MAGVKVTKDSVRRTLRTVVAVATAVATIVGALVASGTIDPEAAPWLSTIVVVSAALTRFMASDLGNRWMYVLFGESLTIDGVRPPHPDDEPVVERPVVEDAPPDPRYPPGL